MRESRERELQPGDEALDWVTYSQVWERHRVTRGALDNLVAAGQVPWVTGTRLRRVLPSADASETYYLVEGVLAQDAAERLSGARKGAQDPAWLPVQYRGATLVQELAPCPTCGAQVPPGQLCKGGGCPVCAPQSLAHDAATRLGFGEDS